MSSSLPPEILDLIFHHLRDEPITLRACCLVSKSWVPWTRGHLFARVKFHSSRLFERWMKAFPDPFSSPAHYTRALHCSLNLFNAAGSDARPWVHSFNRIVELRVMSVGDESQVSFTQLHGLSPTLRRLKLVRGCISPPQVLDFACSFPLLEDLELSSSPHPKLDTDGWDVPPTSPRLTGSLSMTGDNRYIMRKLLDLPGGLRFTKITISCPIKNGDLMEQLVSRCSDTLESLRVEYCYPGTDTSEAPHPLNLSKAAGLRDIDIRLHEPNIRWITTTLRTAKLENLRQITIYLLCTCFFPVVQAARLEWQDLDHLLIKLWTARSIRPLLTCDGVDARRNGEVIPKLLPGLTSRGFFTTGVRTCTCT